MLELIVISTLNGVLFGILLFLMASGLTVILSMLGVLNFAHASFYMLGAFFGFQISRCVGFWPALLIAPLLAGALGAEQRALEIGITIAGGADVILLDEPTAGMSHAETERAVALIRRLTEGRTLMIVEHDMSVVFGLADRISVLVYGNIIATGTPEQIRSDPRVKEAYLGEEAA